jgi:hypothetical protein
MCYLVWLRRPVNFVQNIQFAQVTGLEKCVRNARKGTYQASLAIVRKSRKAKMWGIKVNYPAVARKYH